jgi:DNA-binding LytR/AlgR family response regulator
MIKEYIRQPYPLFENRWRIILSISLFVSLFILIFEPFGISNYAGEFKPLFEAGYGIVTFIVLLIDLFLFPLFLDEWFIPQKWTVYKQMIWQIWILFSIGLGNFLYSSPFLRFSDGLNAFLVFQFYTLVVGIIPILIITILNQNSLLSKNLKLAGEMNADLLSEELLLQDEKVRIMSENNKDKLEINLSDFSYLASTGNYVQVFYLVHNELRNVLLRNTLKQIEEQVKNSPSIIKCHRAFLVNKDKIIRVKGNSQGLRLILKDTNEEIPVSRNYSKSLLDSLNG